MNIHEFKSQRRKFKGRPGKHSFSSSGSLGVSQSDSRTKMNRWTEEEDQRLLKAIEENGPNNWTMIAQIVGGGRTRSQCAQRWGRGLKPGLSHEGWTLEEDEKLLDLVKTYGTKSWVKISQMFGNRCDVQCRYRYQKILKYNLKQNNEGNSNDPLYTDKLKKLKPIIGLSIPEISHIKNENPKSRNYSPNISSNSSFSNEIYSVASSPSYTYPINEDVHIDYEKSQNSKVLLPPISLLLENAKIQVIPFI